MNHEELKKYVSEQLAQGINVDILRSVLISEGETPADVDVAIDAVVNPKPAAKPASTPQSNPASAQRISTPVPAPLKSVPIPPTPIQKSAPAPIKPAPVIPKPAVKAPSLPATPVVAPKAAVPTPVVAPVTPVVPPKPVINTMLAHDPHLVGKPVVGVKTKRRFSIKWVIATVLILGVLGIGGVYAYENLLITPEKISQRMLENAADITSLDFEGTINGSIRYDSSSGFDCLEGCEESTPKSYSGELTFSGSSDISDINNPKSGVNLKVIAEGFVVALESRTVDNVTYFKLNEFPALGFFDEGQIKNQWIKVDPKELQSQLGLTEEEAGEFNNNLSVDQLNKIQEAYVKYPFVKLGQKLPSEKIEGVSTHHYQFSVDTTNLSALLVEVIKSVLPGEMDADSLTTEQLEEVVKKIQFNNGEVWVGKKDYLPRRIKLQVSIVEPEEKIDATFDFDLIYKNFNKPTEIQAPFPAKNFMEIYEQSVGASMAEASMASRDANRLADVRQVMTALELFYNDNNRYPTSTNGQPTATDGGPLKFSDYIGSYPEYPLPSGAPCEDYGAYTYTRQAVDKYTITFCLEESMGGYEAGPRKASQVGIE